MRALSGIREKERYSAMASYHFSAKMIGRSAGKSAIGAAAYRAGATLTCHETGQVFDYAKKRGIEASFILAPIGAPAWATDRQALWSAVQAKESRKNSQLARELVLALPHELDVQDGTKLVRDWVLTNLVAAGMVADIAVHDPDPKDAEDPQNRHAHIMLTMRELDAGQTDGWAKNKARAWNDVGLLEQWRESWASAQNDAFRKLGFSVRVDHRTLTEQRAAAEAAGDEISALVLDREPEPRLGVAASSMEQKARQRGEDVTTELGDAVRASRAHRAELEALASEVRAAELEVLRVTADVVLDDSTWTLPSEAAALAPDNGPGHVRVPEAAPLMADDRTRTAVSRQLAGLGLDQLEISIVGGDRPNVRTMKPAEILADLSRLKRANKAGYAVFVRGPRDRDHDLVLLDDIDAFTAERMAADGLQPAVVVETSPANYQAWIKLGEPVSAELRREAAIILAHRYGGDAAAADGHQSGRLAGFTNPKPEHRRADGRSPFAKLHSYWGKAVSSARELLEAARAALAARPAPAVIVPAPTIDANLLAWWQTGHDAAPAGVSLSEVDWHLTNVAFGSGFSAEAIAAVIEATAGRKGAHAHAYAALTVSKALAERQGPPVEDDLTPGPSF